MTRLSVLDQTPVIAGQRVADAIAATVELAQAADEWGYTRFWCAEHHGLQGVSNPCPEVMLAHLGSLTKRIRIGTGGIMLPYYSPFKVAEQFMMLEALFPHRIDLGVGRAPGGDLRTAQAVAAGSYNHGDQFPQQVGDLVDIFDGTLPADHVAHGVLLQPHIETRPDLWVLGSSEFGGLLAAQRGLKFAFAHFINAHYGHTVAHAYRERFVPRHAGDKPYCAAAVFVICADTETEAAALEAAVDLRRIQMAFGLNLPVPTIAQAQAQALHYGDRERAVIARERPRSIIGTPSAVVEKLLALQDKFAADELIVLSVAPSYRARLRSYELLAEAFQLCAQ